MFLYITVSVMLAKSNTYLSSLATVRNESRMNCFACWCWVHALNRNLYSSSGRFYFTRPMLWRTWKKRVSLQYYSIILNQLNPLNLFIFYIRFTRCDHQIVNNIDGRDRWIASTLHFSFYYDHTNQHFNKLLKVFDTQVGIHYHQRNWVCISLILM